VGVDDLALGVEPERACAAIARIARDRAGHVHRGRDLRIRDEDPAAE
jgi:hypothetical protein